MDLVAEGLTSDASGLLEGMVCIDYVNWRGERSLRRIVPRRLYLGDVEWHSGTQWILDAWDVDKQALRSFALKDVRAWEPERIAT